MSLCNYIYKYRFISDFNQHTGSLPFIHIYIDIYNIYVYIYSLHFNHTQLKHYAYTNVVTCINLCINIYFQCKYICVIYIYTYMQLHIYIHTSTYIYTRVHMYNSKCAIQNTYSPLNKYLASASYHIYILYIQICIYISIYFI